MRRRGADGAGPAVDWGWGHRGGDAQADAHLRRRSDRWYGVGGLSQPARRPAACSAVSAGQGGTDAHRRFAGAGEAEGSAWPGSRRRRYLPAGGAPRQTDPGYPGCRVWAERFVRIPGFEWFGGSGLGNASGRPGSVRAPPHQWLPDGEGGLLRSSGRPGPIRRRAGKGVADTIGVRGRRRSIPAGALVRFRAPRLLLNNRAAWRGHRLFGEVIHMFRSPEDVRAEKVQSPRAEPRGARDHPRRLSRIGRILG